MRGSKLTNRAVYLSKDGNKLMVSDDPLPIQPAERNLMLKGKMIRRKKPYKTHAQYNRVSSLNSVTTTSPTKERQPHYLGSNFIKKQGLKIESKLSTFDILSYLQMKCSEVFFRTQSNFGNFSTKQPQQNYSGKIAFGLKRVPTTQSKPRLKNGSAVNINSLQNSSIEIGIRQQKKQQPPSDLSKSHSPAKAKTGRKNLIGPVINLTKSSKLEGKVKTQEEKARKVQNIDRALLTISHNQLRNVKSQSYAMIEAQSNQLVLMNRGKVSLEIASITKIMTAYVIMTLAELKNINLKEEKIQVQKYVEKTTGTSAELIHGDIYTIQQLLYGLLLPSGNDAALVLADWGGSLLNQDLGKESEYKQNVASFVQHMTKTAKDLGLKDTRYGNPHGLPHSEAKSTAIDQCKLASICMKKNLFNQIVKTKIFKFQILNSDGKKREILWQNTNKLLRREGFIGLKTGITVTAGPCLLSAYQFKQKIYILTVLRSNKVSRRFKDSRKIIFWALSKLYQGKTYFQQSFRLQQLNKNKKQLDSDYSEDQNQFVYGQQGSQQYSRRKNILTNDL